MTHRHLSSLVALITWLLMMAIASFVFSSNQTYRVDFEYTSVTYFNPHLPNWAVNWLAPWANFDGVHYLAIAGEGYTDQGRFFPVYPSVIAFFSWLMGGAATFGLTQLLIASVASISIFLAMIIIWFKLLTKYYTNGESLWTLALFISFPTSFFLVATYSESLFLLLVGITLLLAHHRRWWLAIGCAAIVSITRLTGISIIPALLFLYWQQQNFPRVTQLTRNQWFGFTRIGIPLLSLIGYAYFNSVKWGDWLYFVHAHGQLGNSRTTTSLVFPLVTLYRYLKIITSLSPALHEFRVAWLELLSCFWMLGLAALSWVRKIPPFLLIFAGLTLILPFLSGTLTGFPRYSLVALPFFIPLSSLSPTWKWSLLVTFLILQLLLLSWFSSGYFVG